MIKFNLKVNAYFSLEFLIAKIKKNPYFVKSEIDNQILIAFYNKRVSRATNEEQVIQLCNALLEKLFSDRGFDSFEHAVSAERSVLRKKISGIISKGNADCLGDNLIIEYKYDLNNNKQKEIAEEQLLENIEFLKREGDNAKYLLIATDGLRWINYAHLKDEKIKLRKVEEVEFNGKNIDDFIFYLKGIAFRRKNKVVPTKKRVAADLGLKSLTYLHSLNLLEKSFEKGKNEKKVIQTKFDLWKKQISIAYGSDQSDNNLFLRHTYLTLVSYIFSAIVIESTYSIKDNLFEILTGEWFRKHYVRNLVESDYFTWIIDLYSERNIKEILSEITNILETYDTENVPEDFLKELYQQLVDPQTRHDLGEFYTPEWLADAITENCLKEVNFENELPKILDPSCGSGTFLRSSAKYILEKANKRKYSIPKLIDSVVGIDIHPLAVITAKTNLFITWRKKIKEYAQPISLPVYLANTLTHTVSNAEDAPLIRMMEGDSNRWEIELLGNNFSFSETLLARQGFFNKVIDEIEEICNELVKKYSTENKNNLSNDVKSVLSNYKEIERKDNEELLKYSNFLLEQKFKKNDSVYSFVLRNQSMPKVLENEFDFLIGNPPWLTIKDINNLKYKEQILNLNEKYDCMSRNRGEQSSTEIAALFIPLAARYFLKNKKFSDNKSYKNIGFVLPRSFMTAKQHSQLRNANYHPHFYCAEIWDLNDVDNLFNVPSCVLFFNPLNPLKVNNKFITSPEALKAEINGRVFSGDGGNLIMSKNAEEKIDFKDSVFHYLNIKDKISAYVDIKNISQDFKNYLKKINYFKKQLSDDFQQGGIFYPQPLMIVDIVEKLRHPITRIRTNADARKKTKKESLRNFNLDQLVDTKSLFLTAAGEHIYPFSLKEDSLWHVVLPGIQLPSGNLSLKSSQDLRKEGLTETAKYWSKVEDEWNKLKNNNDEELFKRIDFNSNLTNQNLQKRYLLLANASGSRQYVSFTDTETLPLPFIARDKTYQWRTNDKNEAGYYLGILNSDFINSIVDPFINLGLLGKRDIGTRMFSLPIPPYDQSQVLQTEISTKALNLYSKSNKLIRECNDQKSLIAKDVGILRRQIRNALHRESEELNNLIILYFNSH